MREEALAQTLKGKVQALKEGLAGAAPELQVRQHTSSFKRPEVAAAPIAVPIYVSEVPLAAPVPMMSAKPLFRGCFVSGCGEDGTCANDLHPELAAIHLNIFSNPKTNGQRILDNPLADHLFDLDAEAHSRKPESQQRHGFAPISATSPVPSPQKGAAAFKRVASAFQSIR
jgi:hypothetical protein